ncbi:MAG: hypothetical protein IJW48_05805 [Clostridia bacterium]|nr:hypothetical protein [Clostridia bacterium]MBQ7363942.1 hypothetical protein [Clostridia bacterium]
MNVKSKSGSLGIFGTKGMLAVALMFGLGVLLIFFGMSDTKESATAEVSTEESIETICSAIEGVGECRVLISYEREGGTFGTSEREVIKGIIVVCEGGSSDKVRQRVTDALSSLYGIGANRIRVEQLR